MSKKSILQNIFIALIYFCSAAGAAFAQTTTFTYQGKLTDTGTAQATYQMQFKLFDAISSGNQEGATLINPSVAVSSGVFTVNLDFGAAVFDGADRFLEIAVKRNAGDQFTVLTPRHKILSAPFAVKSKSSDTATTAISAGQLDGLPSSSFVQFDVNGDVSIGTTSTGSKLTVAGVIESTAGGIKFPDATTQTTAGLTAVITDATLTGEGTTILPLGIASPLTIRDRDNPALQPIQMSGVTFAGTNPILTVPAGKRLVIEFISGSLSIASGQRFLSAYLRTAVDSGANLRNHYFTPVLAGTSGGVDYFTISQSVRIYANPGTIVYLGSSSTNNNGTFNGTISGYYVDLP